MKRTVLVCAVLVLAAAPLAACGSSAGTSAGTSGAAAPISSSEAPTPSVSDIPSCAEVKVAASHLTTFLHYVALDVGSSNDPSPYFTEMRDTVASLRAAQSLCSADASGPLTALASGVESLATAYRQGTSADVIAADKAAVLALVPLGKAVYTALGMDPSPWDTAPRFPV